MIITIDGPTASGKSTVAVRIPKLWSLNFLCQELDEPIISTSVNLTKEKPALSFANISQDILKKVDFIAKEPLPNYNKASTIIDVSCSPYRVVRGQLG